MIVPKDGARSSAVERPMRGKVVGWTGGRGPTSLSFLACPARAHPTFTQSFLSTPRSRPPSPSPFSPSLLSSAMAPSYGLAELDGKKQTTFAAPAEDDSTARGSPTNIKSKNQLVDEYNPALRTPSGVHPLLVDELLPADNYAKGNDGQIHYWADLPAGGESPRPSASSEPN